MYTTREGICFFELNYFYINITGKLYSIGDTKIRLRLQLSMNTAGKFISETVDCYLGIR